MDGDTGNLTGAYRDGTFVMSHFSGARPLLLEVTLEDDGSLRLLQNRQRELTAVRSDSAAAAALPRTARRSASWLPSSTRTAR